MFVLVLNAHERRKGVNREYTTEEEWLDGINLISVLEKNYV
jgi:hypothetical protein